MTNPSMDISRTLIPRTDQLNSDHLITGPRTVTITAVTKGTVEQPVNLTTAEFGDGQPYKPGLSMRRVIAACWGTDASQYIGRKLTLYRDEKVRWAGQEIGGIRISHASHIDKPITVNLTVTRGKRAPFTVQPLKAFGKSADSAATGTGQ